MSTAAPPSHNDTKVDRLGDLTTFGGSKRAAWARRQRAPLSRPTPCRSTPITTTALPFMVRLDSEGAMEARLIA